MTTRNDPTTRSSASERGFTLIELIVVITIIGLLASMVVVNVVGKTDDAKIAKVRGDFSSISAALDDFYISYSRYPDSTEELMNPPEKKSGVARPYLKRMPKDPWSGEDYIWEENDNGIRLKSYGSDQTEGGEGYAADLYSDDEL